MKIRIRIPSIVIFFLFTHASLQGQTIQTAIAEVNDGQGGFFSQWDAVQKKLLLYRDIKMSSAPAARMYGTDGSEMAVFPVKDLQDAWYADVWAVAATPEGGMVLAAGVGYTAPGAQPAEIKTVLLTYDRNSKLEKVWEVWPYQFFDVAVDSFGNIFGKGLKETDSSDYPLIVKYSPRGKILKEFFPLSFLPDGEETFHPDPKGGGQDQMFIAGDKLFVWLARPKELFQFSLDGELLSRTSFKPALSLLATKTDSVRVGVQRVSTNESGEIIAQLVFWNLDKSARHPFTQLALFGQKGDIQQVTPIAAPSNTAVFLWGSTGGKNMYLDYDADIKIVRLAEH
ncbi:MAG TPA: hypothetical protein VJX70_14255 [Candidatus Acidoferrum sp.]|nr:hypothetical protein [Candidatus Acidoferrum sp.]